MFHTQGLFFPYFLQFTYNKIHAFWYTVLEVLTTTITIKTLCILIPSTQKKCPHCSSFVVNLSPQSIISDLVSLTIVCLFQNAT
jgi:hypothetical protein